MRWAPVAGSVMVAAATWACTACGCDLEIGRNSCSTDADCRSGEVCGDYGTCRALECRSDDQCGTGRLCTSSFLCQAGCRFDRDCGEGLVCGKDVLEDWKTCRLGCRSDADCGATKVCDLGACRAGCRTNADCPAATFCLNASTQRAGLCAAGCHDDGECSAKQVCTKGTCAAACERAADCGANAICVELDAFGSVRSGAGSAAFTCLLGERCLCVDTESSEGDADLDGAIADGSDRGVDAGHESVDGGAASNDP